MSDEPQEPTTEFNIPKSINVKDVSTTSTEKETPSPAPKARQTRAKKKPASTRKSTKTSAAKDKPKPKSSANSEASATKQSPKVEKQQSEPTNAGLNYADDLLHVMQSSQKLATHLLNHTPEHIAPSSGMADPMNVGKSFGDLILNLMTHPQHLMQAQYSLWNEHMKLWQSMAMRATGKPSEPVAVPEKGDKRFRHEDWEKNEIFDFIKQSYLITARWLIDTVDSVEGLDQHTKHKVVFHTKQLVDAFSPTNFPLTNPEVLRTSLETGGDNFIRGLNNFLKDLDRGNGQLQISQTDMDYFEVGKNVATTPGKVVFQNDLFQLLQYTPTTEKVYKKPLLIFPPWINKYYIMDLQPANSLIRWIVSKGYTVFVVSWVNPDERLAKKSFEDYMREGAFEALNAVKLATGEDEVNTIGYCIGGTMLGSTLAYMAAHDDNRITSATFFAAQLDFVDAGDLNVFIDDEQLKSLEKRMEAHGYLDGNDMAQTFNMLRANDLIWSYVVNNYLLGKEPFRFDLLFWNADATRMPMNLHSYYLREFYLNNRLSKGELKFGDTVLDLSKVKASIYMQSSKEDHIAPAKSVFNSHKLFCGSDDVTFMVAGSGHIAGVINHPDAKKYMYWTNKQTSENLDDWWSGAEEHPGSWWPEWELWLRKKSGTKVAARIPGDGKLDVLEDAPGSYVLIKS